MTENRVKSYRDFSIGDWAFLALVGCGGYFIAGFLPKEVCIAKLSIGFWITLIPICCAIIFINRPPKKNITAIPDKSWIGNAWATGLLMPGSFLAIPIIVVFSFFLTKGVGVLSIECVIYLSIGLLSIYLAVVCCLMYCQRTEISVRELLHTPPKKVFQAMFNKQEELGYVERTLKLNYRYQDAFQLALASLGVLKSFQVQSIDERSGQVIAISGYKSLSNRTIFIRLKELSNEETLISVGAESENERESPVGPILAYLNDLNSV